VAVVVFTAAFGLRLMVAATLFSDLERISVPTIAVPTTVAGRGGGIRGQRR
jgi:hypothetical protein